MWIDANNTLWQNADGTVLDTTTGQTYDANGNLVTDPSLSTAPANPSLGNNNNPSNAPIIAATLAQYGAAITGILAGRAVQTSPGAVRVAPAPTAGMIPGTQISFTMLLLLALGGLLIYKVLA